MKCSNCSQDLLPDAAFCTNCGAKAANDGVLSEPCSCNKCGSRDVQSFKMANMSGTTSVNGIHSGAVLTGNGIGFASGGFSGRQYSQLARATVPPSQKSAAPWLALIIPLIAILAYFDSPKHSTLTLLGLLFIFVGCPSFVFIKFRKYREEYRKAYALWKRSWICHSCGNTFYN